MKGINSSLHCIILAAMVWEGCDLKTSASFERPQPEGQRDERLIPDKLIGYYINPEDSSSIRITKDDVTRSSLVKLNGTLDSADRVKIKRDTSWIERGSDYAVYVKVVGDSVFMRTRELDTLFAFSSDDVIRKFRRSYFLNQKYYSGWEVRRIRPIKGGFAIGVISGGAELEKLRSITNEADSIYHFDPTRKQFKELVKRDGFKETIYLKQRQ